MPHSPALFFKENEMGRIEIDRAAELGRRGERITEDYLTRYGFIIFKRNYSCRFGEIDLIAEKGALLLFVEVKTRCENAWSAPAAAVDSEKQHRLRMTAADFLSKTHREYQCRFDVSEVYVRNDGSRETFEIRYIRDAFR